MDNGSTNTNCGHTSSTIIGFHGYIHQQNPGHWCSMKNGKPTVDAQYIDTDTKCIE